MWLLIIDLLCFIAIETVELLVEGEGEGSVLESFSIDLHSSYCNARHIRTFLGRNPVPVDFVSDWVFRGYCAVLPRYYCLHHGNLKTHGKILLLRIFQGSVWNKNCEIAMVLGTPGYLLLLAYGEKPR